VNNGGLTGFELAGSNHFIEMKQDGGPAAVARVGTSKFSLLPSDAEAAYKRVVLSIVKLDGGDGKNIVVGPVRVNAKLLGELAQRVQ
jgi:hypothetical protein